MDHFWSQTPKIHEIIAIKSVNSRGEITLMVSAKFQERMWLLLENNRNVLDI